MRRVRPTVANMARVSFEEKETFGAGVQVAAMATVVWTARIGFFKYHGNYLCEFDFVGNA